jgi:hypothetical protein
MQRFQHGAFAMFKKSLIAAALVVPAFALSSAAFAGQVYQGGPKSGLSASAQTFEANKPYAQFVPDNRAATSKHTYRGGPKTLIPHSQR